jgi:hypothetical protein
MFVTNSSENNVLKQVCVKNENSNKSNYKKSMYKKVDKNKLKNMYYSGNIKNNSSMFSNMSSNINYINSSKYSKYSKYRKYSKYNL